MSNNKEIKTVQNEVSAAPPCQTEIEDNNSGVWCGILANLCAAMFKNPQIAEIVPHPSQNMPLNAVITGRLRFTQVVEGLESMMIRLSKYGHD